MLEFTDYPFLMSSLMKLKKEESKEITRQLIKSDLYFLLRYILKRRDIEKKWLFERCNEIQADPDGYLDLWARGHYKSTIITYAKTIQDIICNPELTFGIFSHNRPAAKDFLRQIKVEFERNDDLRYLFPDILYDYPQNQSPKWTEDDGIVVKRKGNPKESTLEAWGLVDGMPTGKHYDVRIYDDLITEKTVSTPEMIKKVTKAWELSNNLGKEGGKERYIGTRYHLFDTYGQMIERNIVKVRLYPATHNSKVDGEPVLFSKEEIKEKRKIQGPYTFSCQMLLNPIAEEVQGFSLDWLRYHDGSDGNGMNKYIIVDPASDKKKTSDYTSMWVIGYGEDNNYYILDMVRDRLSLTERANMLFLLHKKWQPLDVGYEKYGMMADIEHIKYIQSKENYHFEIKELSGNLSKNDRIRRLVPIFESGRLYFPSKLYKSNYEGENIELVSTFITDELLSFPVSKHDDMLDALSRIVDEDFKMTKPVYSWSKEIKYNNDKYIV